MFDCLRDNSVLILVGPIERRIIELSSPIFIICALDSNLHSVSRQLIELRMEHADLDAMIDRLADQTPLDELMIRRLKKRRLGLRDEMARLEREITPDEPA
jgi:hypothetical protein